MKKILIAILLFTAYNCYAVDYKTANALPISGGTLTGALSGTSASFSGNVQVNGTLLGMTNVATPTITLYDTTNNYGTILWQGNTQGAVGTITNNPFHITTNDTARITVAASGEVGISSTAWTGGGLLTVGSGSTPAFMVESAGGVYPKRAAGLPTTGYAEGSLYYNTTDHTLYISTGAVTHAGFWRPVW